MIFLEGYTKQIYLDRALAASGGPGWVIRVVGRSHVEQFAAWSWRLRSFAPMEGRGGAGEMLTPIGPAYWVETTAEIETLDRGFVQA